MAFMRSEKDTAAGAKRRRWLLIGVAVGAAIVLAVGAYVVVRLTGHGDPDPGGRIAEALKSTDFVVPDDATNVKRTVATPHWDSCSGREGTFGWSALGRYVEFSTAQQPDDMAKTAQARLAPEGWVGPSRTTTPFGPSFNWKRTMPDGTPLSITLSPLTNDFGKTIFWNLTGIGIPHGPTATGC